ncbi:MAG: calcineurin-like phosphoesterase C-terminal domain-containing protein [Alistipes sp.]|nr:calcineurin-like phosphoesterase C-terminal domain-containing protein [Alistipes sp.]
MKKYFLFLAAAAFMAVGCNPTPDDGNDTPTPTPDGEGQLKEFVVEIDNPVSRAAVNGNVKSVWNNDDRLTVVRFDSPTTRPKLVQCTIDNSTIEGSSAKFTTTGYINLSGEQYAVYPMNSSAVTNFTPGNTENGRVFTITLPEQKLDDKGQIVYPLLVGNWESSTQSFKMVNPLAMLQLTLTTPSSESYEYTLNSIEVSGENGEKMWGDVTVSTKTPVAQFDKATQTSTTLNCGGVKIGKQGTTVTLFIPKQEYQKGFSLKLTCTEGVMTTTVLSSGIDCTEIENDLVAANVEVVLEKSPIIVSGVRSTDSTIVIGWTIDEKNAPYVGELIPNAAADYTEEIKKSYKVALYKSADCSASNLVVSVDNLPGSAFQSPLVPPRFIFTGLTPATDYYAMVYNTTDGKQTTFPVKVSTEAASADKSKIVTSNAKAGDLVVYENFAGIIYAGDLSARAAGVSRSDRGSLTSLAKLTGEIALSDTGYILANAGTEIGLFNTLAGVLDDMGIQKWGWIGGKSGANGGSLCARPGFVKIGTTANRSFLCTPIINAIPTDMSAKLKVVFKAAPYGDYNKMEINEAEKAIAVKALAGASLGSDYLMSYASVAAEQTLTLEGTNNTDWKEYTVYLDNVPAGSSVAIGGALDATTTNRLLLDDVRVYVEALESLPPHEGVISDKSGNPVSGVVVTDGYSVTKTDSNGKFTIERNNKARFIYYTTPAEYEIALAEDGYPLFYKSLPADDLNFTLGEKITKQNKWHLYVMADPQTNQTGRLCIPYFSNYIATDIKAMVEREGYNSAQDWNGGRLAYGMVLGDVIWNSAKVSYMGQMKAAMAPDKTNVSWFTVPGNHDWYASDSDTNPNLDCYHTIFGPSVYSFDRGDVHVVGMNNVITGPGKKVEEYNEGFTEDEYNWLVKDLEQVPTDKCVVLCVHVPFFDGEAGVRHSKYYSQTLNLLKRYANAYILSGHNHYSRHWVHTSYGYVHEMNHGAACGQFWNLKICADGTPAGYYVYTFEGNDCSDMFFKAAGSASSAEGVNALRMYLGSDSCDTRITSGYGKDSKTVYINLYNGNLLTYSDASPLNKAWKIELLYKGSKVMDMVNVTRSNNTYGYHDMPSDYESYYSTWLINSSYLRNDTDWWYNGRGLAANSTIKNRDGNKWGGALSNSSYKKNTTHIFAGTLPEDVTLDSSDVMVRATAPTGQVYEVTTFTKFSSIDGLAWELY